MRKAAIVGTGGLARAAINPNSKKERTAKANEKMLKLKKAEAKREQAEARRATAERPSSSVEGWGPSTPASSPSPQGIVAPSDPSTAGAARTAMSVADELEKLAALRDSGVLTAEEFETQKARVLNA